MLNLPSEDEYNVQLVDLPCSVRGAVSTDPEGFPTVFINARLSKEEQRKALRHELAHLANNDLINSLPLHVVENR